MAGSEAGLRTVASLLSVIFRYFSLLILCYLQFLTCHIQYVSANMGRWMLMDQVLARSVNAAFMRDVFPLRHKRKLSSGSVINPLAPEFSFKF